MDVYRTVLLHTGHSPESSLQPWVLRLGASEGACLIQPGESKVCLHATGLAELSREKVHWGLRDGKSWQGGLLEEEGGHTAEEVQMERRGHQLLQERAGRGAERVRCSSLSRGPCASGSHSVESCRWCVTRLNECKEREVPPWGAAGVQSSPLGRLLRENPHPG